jgi:hypothetical protein
VNLWQKLATDSQITVLFFGIAMIFHGSLKAILILILKQPNSLIPVPDVAL